LGTPASRAICFTSIRRRLFSAPTVSLTNQPRAVRSRMSARGAARRFWRLAIGLRWKHQAALEECVTVSCFDSLYSPVVGATDVTYAQAVSAASQGCGSEREL
jgi:hypothetical protein